MVYHTNAIRTFYTTTKRSDSRGEGRGGYTGLPLIKCMDFLVLHFFCNEISLLK